MEANFECPLLNKKIDAGYCYDINMVNSGMIKENVLEDKIDKVKASDICKNCKYKQI